MKVYLAPQPGLSRAMDRVAQALTTQLPDRWQPVETETDADLIVLHVIGWPETVEATKRALDRGQRVAFIQYCLTTTQQKDLAAWHALWALGVLVWSYYPIPMPAHVPFYFAPLGVDPTVFRLDLDFAARERPYTVLTSGFVRDSESVGEVSAAVAAVGGMQFHLGPSHVVTGSHVVAALNISDARLAQIYRSCQYVSGLRREEGFELPAAEGLVCGARPILYDQPHYRAWYEPWGIFIPEAPAPVVQKTLEQLFLSPVTPVNAFERKAAQERFSWPVIARGFWARVCEGLG